ncbi:endoglucanase II [Colletotrichum truncatum]|uniref:Endoglucanase II n=1 Tax=Colletotrichum truncatum TaxID=5467 RepID=A0ACC3YPC9_COLTU|nr:endoglucanase II [Colletotrichum truncatum]KAF6784201.1 endoglucanase II [Colletotrichum truncatum]
MKTFYASFIAAAAGRASAHALFQQLWVNGVDLADQCVRLPDYFGPIYDIESNDIICNQWLGEGKGKCPVTAGDTVTVEMHRLPNARQCNDIVIADNHLGPVNVYLAKVNDSATIRPQDVPGWFKIFEDTWNPNGPTGYDDHWGTKDIQKCCGKLDVKIPKDIAPGDYLLRAELIAYHLSGSQGTEHYMSCFQLTVAGNGTAKPSLVKFPGAYQPGGPGLSVKYVPFVIHCACIPPAKNLRSLQETVTAFTPPGPTVYAGGTTKEAGSPCSNCEKVSHIFFGPTFLSFVRPRANAFVQSCQPPATARATKQY